MYRTRPILVVLVLLLWRVATERDGRNTSLPIKPKLSSMQLDMVDNASCPTGHQRDLTLKSISSGINTQLKDILNSVVPCDPTVIGKVAHCPAKNCSEIFRKVETGIFHFSGFYWLKLPDENATRVFCNRDTGYPEVASCNLLFRYHPPANSGHYTLLLPDGVRSIVYCNKKTRLPEPESCAHAHQLELPSGNYTIHPPGHSTVNVYCDMDREECGSKWWVQVASLDFSDPSTICPGNWDLITSPIRGCVRSIADGCDSITFPVLGHTYNHVCGRVLAHQRGPAFGFWLSSHSNSLDTVYLNGASITHGGIPRKHIWSFAASLGESYCPCSRADAPHPGFVGNNYFCESHLNGGLQEGVIDLDRPLWDGEDCSAEDTCCSFNHPPWFSTALPNTTSDDIEVRLCGLTNVTSYSTPISLLELYVQ